MTYACSHCLWNDGACPECLGAPGPSEVDLLRAKHLGGHVAGRLIRYLRWKWHLLRWRDRDATWHAIHSYGCPACEDR